MSMFAERKQKQRFSLNPRGKFWTDDKNKFGQKMLEKMGWTSGKGLGAKENGIKESLKVRHKDNLKGLGYKEDDNAWTQHDINFSKFLESLSAENSSETSNDGITKPKKSLEELSKNSRARVHYHKFTRSKDISKMSEKDLKSVFGKKDISSNGLVNPAFDTNDSKENSTDLSNIRTEIPDFGVTNFGFVDFSQKNNSTESSEEETSENNPEYYKTSHVNLKDQYKQLFIKSNDNSIGKKQDVVEDVEEVEEKMKRSSKKSKRNREEDDHCHKKRSKLFKQELNHSVYEGIDNLGCTANTDEQKLEEVITGMNNKIDEYENEVENEINERKCVQMTETCEEFTTEVRKKKKSKKNKVDIEETDVNNKSKSDEELNTIEEITSKKTKKSKRRVSFNDNLPVSAEENEVTESIKKSNRRVSFGETTVEIFDTEARIQEKKSKKTKKDKFQEIVTLPEESPITETTKKQKKRKNERETEENHDLKESADDNTVTKKEKHNKLETILESEEQPIDDSTEKTNGDTKKKKSKKNKEKANSDENSSVCQEEINQSFDKSSKVEHRLKFFTKKEFLKRQLTNENGVLDVNFEGSNLLKIPGYGAKL